MNALSQAGVAARMLVVDKRTDSDDVARVGSPITQRYCFLAERLKIFASNGFNRRTLFKIDTATHGISIAAHPWVQWADVVVLGWINQGMLSLNGVEQLMALGKPIVWVMHDMWNCTGVCHHAGQCTAFETTCRSCPLTGKNGDDISTATQHRKQQLYGKGNIHFVAVSHWLEHQCRRSSLMRDANISVIANPFPTAQFSAAFDADNPWHIAPDRKIVVMGAARLDDPVKGFDTLIDTTHHIARHMPHLAQQLHLVLYGKLRDTSLLERLELPYTHLGYVSDLKSVYSHAHIVISTSRVESFGYTLVEGMACGCTAVTTGNGGQTDIVEHLKNGYVAHSGHPQDIARGLEWAVDHMCDRAGQHCSIEQRFDQAVIARRHITLYNELITGKFNTLS